MHLHLSDEFRGRVDVVPGCCHVATEFVCVWFFPILPRRSILFFRAAPVSHGWSTLPVRLSWRSVVVTYLRTALWGLVLVSGSALVEGSRKELPQIAPLACSVAGAAGLLLFLLGRLTLASYSRRERLAETDGLPPDVAALLRDECFSPRRDVLERSLIISSEGDLPVAKPWPVKVRAKPPGATLLASPVRRTCAWFFDSLLAIILYLLSICALFALTALGPATERFILGSMGALSLGMLMAIVVAYNVAFTASPLRATPGKRFLGLRVVDARGRTLGPTRAFAREAVKYPCLILEACLAGLQVRRLAVHDPESGRALHDRLSRTQIVMLPCRGSSVDGRPK